VEKADLQAWRTLIMAINFKGKVVTCSHVTALDRWLAILID
jgi:hypothetical protein